MAITKKDVAAYLLTAFLAAAAAVKIYDAPSFDFGSDLEVDLQGRIKHRNSHTDLIPFSEFFDRNP